MTLPKSILRHATTMGLACALAGCAQGPGDVEVREAISARLVSMGLGPTGARETSEFNETLAKVKVIACKKADANNGFNCDWTGAEQFAPVIPNSGRLVKSDKG
jgi:hypothetical protein